MYLLDTHVLLWSIGKSRELSGKVRGILEESSNEILISSVSLWEVSLKYSLGKLLLGSIGPEDIPSYCETLGYQIVPLGPVEASTCYKLKKYENHKDPFDRMLIHQCIQMKMILLSRDERMSLYKKQGLKCIW